MCAPCRSNLGNCPDMLTSDDRKEVDLHLKRGSIARGVFRDILELEILKICHNSMMYWGGGVA